MATTPCPHCQAEVPVPDGAAGRRGTCLSCGGQLRFVEASERPCDGCGGPVALPPGEEAVTCGTCGLLQARESGRGVVVEVRCPRCRRRLTVEVGDVQVTCAHCGVDMVVEQA